MLAHYRDRAGIGDIDIDVPSPTKVSLLLYDVLKRHPNIAGDRSRLVIAVNGEYQGQDYTVADGDEVALIPPVSGGSR